MVNIYNQVNTKLQDKYCIYRKKFRTTFKRRCVKHRDKTELILGPALLEKWKECEPKKHGKGNYFSTLKTTVFLGYLLFIFQRKIRVLIIWKNFLICIHKFFYAYRNCMGLRKTLVRLAKVQQWGKLEIKILDNKNAKATDFAIKMKFS